MAADSRNPAAPLVLLAAPLVWLAAYSFVPPPLASAEEGESIAMPKILLAAPLAATPGETTKLTLRGEELKNISGVRPSDSRAVVKLGEQGSAPVPGGQNAARIGDTQVQIELELPADFDAATLSLVAVTDQGESEPYEIFAAGHTRNVPEQEPNNGFSDCRVLQIPLVVDGMIERDRDVDLFAVEVVAGRRLVCEVIAARRGSGCDATLILYDAQRRPMAFGDDHAGSRDPRLEITIPATGRYYLAVADASDQGGPAHPYRLVVDDSPAESGTPHPLP